MSTTPDDRFDHAARAAHAASLDRLSPRVEAQLAQRRRAALSARAGHRRAWPWATAVAASVALVAVLQLRPPGPDATAPGAGAPPRLAAAPMPAADALLAEDPDMYLWLASTDGLPDVE